jgi:hypothetical protein
MNDLNCPDAVYLSAGPRATDQVLQPGTAEFVTEKDERNQHQSHSPPFSSATDDKPDPQSQKDNPDGPELDIVGDERPESITDGIAQSLVDENEQTLIN